MVAALALALMHATPGTIVATPATLFFADASAISQKKPEKKQPPAERAEKNERTVEEEPEKPKTRCSRNLFSRQCSLTISPSPFMA